MARCMLLEAGLPITYWGEAVLYAVFIRNRCSTAALDGKTPYERIRLRPFNTRLLHFAENCLYKTRAKEPVREEHKWNNGIFLGICPLTGQYILHDAEKRSICMARTVKLVPDQSKWNARKHFLM